MTTNISRMFSVSRNFSIVSQDLLMKKTWLKSSLFSNTRKPKCGDERRGGGDKTYHYRVVWLLVLRACARSTCWEMKPKDMTRVYPLTILAEDGSYDSFFFHFSIFPCDASISTVICGSMYVCIMYVLYMYSWARIGPLHRNREVDTKRFTTIIARLDTDAP